MKHSLIILIGVLVFFSCTQKVPEDVVDNYIPPPQSVVDKQFNFHIVEPGIWRSSQPNRESIIRMSEHGLKTIINLRGDEETNIWEGKLSDSLGINYISNHLDASKKLDLAKLKNILSIVEDSTQQPVLIHCLGGKDRTGLIIGMYQLKNTNLTLDEIKKEMIIYGHDVDNLKEVFIALEEYHNELNLSR